MIAFEIDETSFDSELELDVVKNLLNLYAVNEEEDYYDYWCGGPDEDYDINISKDEDVYNLNIFELVPTEFGTRRGYVVSYCRMKVIRENS